MAVDPEIKDGGAAPVAALTSVTRTFMKATTVQLVLGVLALGLVMTGGMVYREFAQNALNAQAHRSTRQAHVMGHARTAVTERVARFEQALRGAQGLFAASKSVERGQWRQYLKVIEQSLDFRGVDAMLVITRITEANPEKFLTYPRGDERPDFAIIPPPADKQTTPGEVWVVTHCEPAVVADALMGHDARALDGRREAMELARDTDALAITPILHDLPGTNQTGLIMYLPIYSPDQAHTTVEERRAALWGWVGIRVRLNEFLFAGDHADHANHANIDLFDGPNLADGKSAVTQNVSDGHLTGTAGTPDDSTHTPLTIGGRTWMMRVHIPDELEAGRFRWILLIGGVAGSLVAAGLAGTLSRTRNRALQLADGITAELRKNAARLQDANAELMFQKAALDHAAIVLETDAKGQITHVNDNFCAISGYTREELLGKNPRLVNSCTQTKDFWREAFATVAREGVWCGIVCNRARDGELYWVRSTIVVFRDGSGNNARFVGIQSDITAQILAERAAVKSEQFAQATVNALTAHVSILDETGTIIAVNDSWKEYGGRNNGKVKPTCAGVNYLDVCDRAAGKNSEEAGVVAQGIRDVIRGIEPSFSAHYPCHGPNEKRWFTVRVTRMPGEGPVQVVVAHENITEVRLATVRLEEQAEKLVAARELAEAANKAKSEFLATMSHEIRTPLNGVVGTLGLIEGSALNEQQRRYLKIGRSSAMSLLSVINDILDFSKIEAGKMELSPTDFDLYDVVEEVMEMLAIKACEKRLEMVCTINRSMPRMVQGDADRIRQIIVNLVNNAIKFTPEGAVTLLVAPAINPAASGQPRIRISVTDTGVGIPQDRLNRLFKSFSQTDASTTRKYGGTGLGLAICKQLAELMGGSIGVESEPGRGSTFWVELALPVAQGSTQGITQGSTPALHEITPVDLKSARVLVIDNFKEQREMIAQTLSSIGIQAETACDGEEGLETLLTASAQGKPFAAVVVDYEMPGLNGFEIAVALQCKPELSGIPKVLISSAMDLDQSEIQSLGFVSHLIKPIRQSALVNAIMKATASSDPTEQSLPALAPQSDLPAFSGPRVRLLLAEDNDINQLIACEMLTRFGFDCTVAPNGKAAVLALQESAFDVVLMDCQMPEMDGFEATREIRRLEQAGILTIQAGRRLPIIALTANALKGDRELCLEAGMDAYATKPFDLKKLKATIVGLLLPAPSVRAAA